MQFRFTVGALLGLIVLAQFGKSQRGLKSIYKDQLLFNDEPISCEAINEYCTTTTRNAGEQTCIVGKAQVHLHPKIYTLAAELLNSLECKEYKSGLEKAQTKNSKSLCPKDLVLTKCRDKLFDKFKTHVPTTSCNLDSVHCQLLRKVVNYVDIKDLTRKDFEDVTSQAATCEGVGPVNLILHTVETWLKEQCADVVITDLNITAGVTTAEQMCIPLGLVSSNWGSALNASVSILSPSSCAGYVSKYAEAVSNKDSERCPQMPLEDRCHADALALIRHALPKDTCQLSTTWCPAGTSADSTLNLSGIAETVVNTLSSLIKSSLKVCGDYDPLMQLLNILKADLAPYCKNAESNVEQLLGKVLEIGVTCSKVKLDVTTLQLPYLEVFQNILAPKLESSECKPYIDALKVAATATNNATSKCPSKGVYDTCTKDLRAGVDELLPKDCVKAKMDKDSCKKLGSLLSNLFVLQKDNSAAAGELCGDVLPLRAVNEVIYTAHQAWCSSTGVQLDALPDSPLSEDTSKAVEQEIAQQQAASIKDSQKKASEQTSGSKAQQSIVAALAGAGALIAML